ncbi:MAG: hypothetical protein IPK08_07745 [Bacteroidetes bacterium]|nr:hypothetical protein [Bacteroidota bacterium]
MVITQGLRNSGPDVDIWRSPATGNVIDEATPRVIKSEHSLLINRH